MEARDSGVRGRKLVWMNNQTETKNNINTQVKTKMNRDAPCHKGVLSTPQLVVSYLPVLFLSP